MISLDGWRPRVKIRNFNTENTEEDTESTNSSSRTLWVSPFVNFVFKSLYVPDQPEIKADGLSARKRRLFAFVLLLVGLFIGLLFSEIALRVAGYSSPEFYMADETRGYALIPDMRGQYRKEGRSFVEINSDGFRDVERSVAKPQGVTRIAVIGDSYVEAFQVERDESFAMFMRSGLERCGAFPRIEVLTFGVSGYGTGQALLTFREKVLKYSPDVVMLVMTTNNDISDNTRFFKKTAIPYFEYRGDELALDDRFRTERAFIARSSAISRLGISLKNYLRTVQAIGEIQVALKYRYQRWKEKAPSPTAETAAPTRTTEPNPPAPVAEAGIESQVYRPSTDENWQNAWRVTEGTLELMHREVGNANAKFVVVTASNGAQVLPNVETRKLFAKNLGIDDLFYPDRRIAEFCRLRSIRVVTLAPALADFTEREQVNIHGFEGNIGYGHWNKLGHSVAGTELGRQMCEVSVR